MSIPNELMLGGVWVVLISFVIAGVATLVVKHEEKKHKKNAPHSLDTHA